MAYGALLDLSVMVTYGGEQSLDRYLALSARGVPFNVAHAAGNFVLALAAGLALDADDLALPDATPVPAGGRRAPLSTLLAALALVAGPRLGEPAGAGADTSATAPSAARAQASQSMLLAGAPRELRRRLRRHARVSVEPGDDGLGDARAGGGRTEPARRSRRRSERRRLPALGDRAAAVAGAISRRTILALRGAGLDPRGFAGLDLVAALRRKRDRDGSVDGQVNLTAFFVLAMRAARRRPWRPRASRGLAAPGAERGRRLGISPQAPSDPDSTGAALQALAAAGADGRSSSAGVRWLRRAQRPDGDTLATNGVVNARSTAWAVQGLVAAGGGGGALRDALGHLGRLRAGDGHYRYSRASDQTGLGDGTRRSSPSSAARSTRAPWPQGARRRRQWPRRQAGIARPAQTRPRHRRHRRRAPGLTGPVASPPGAGAGATPGSIPRQGGGSARPGPTAPTRPPPGRVRAPARPCGGACRGAGQGRGARSGPGGRDRHRGRGGRRDPVHRATRGRRRCRIRAGRALRRRGLRRARAGARRGFFWYRRPAA